MSTVLLDTHALIWLMQGSERLGLKSRRLADRARGSGRLLVSPISYWEIADLISIGRMRLNTDVASWCKAVAQAGIVELPLTSGAAIRASEVLPDHPDRMDRLLVGSALTQSAIFLTADVALLDWRGPLLRQDASL